MRMKRTPVRAWGAFGLVATALVLSIACAARTGTVGAVLGQDSDGRLFVREAPDDLAAAQGGVRPGDEILLIDGRDARAMTPRGVHEALSGEIGETVRLTLVRDGRIVRVSLKRTPARRHRLSESG
jgi:C-terminal processing protease CtpA/Prc